VIARVAVEEFVTGKVDELYLAFTRFVNTLRQEPTIRRLLPFVPEEEDVDNLPPLQYLFEPDPETVLNEVIPRLIEVAVFQTILESKASAFSAQMVAMRNANGCRGGSHRRPHARREQGTPVAHHQGDARDRIGGRGPRQG